MSEFACWSHRIAIFGGYFLGVIYQDNTFQGKEAALELARAADLLNKLETEVGKKALPAWHHEAFYRWGQVEKSLGDCPAAKKAWQQFMLREPPDTPPDMFSKKKDVRRWLDTAGRGC